MSRDGDDEAILQGRDPWLARWDRLPDEDRHRLTRLALRRRAAEDPGEALLTAGFARKQRRQLRWQLLTPALVSLSSLLRLSQGLFGGPLDRGYRFDIVLVTAAACLLAFALRNRAVLRQAGDRNEARYRAAPNSTS